MTLSHDLAKLEGDDIGPLSVAVSLDGIQRPNNGADEHSGRIGAVEGDVADVLGDMKQPFAESDLRGLFNKNAGLKQATHTLSPRTVEIRHDGNRGLSLTLIKPFFTLTTNGLFPSTNGTVNFPYRAIAGQRAESAVPHPIPANENWPSEAARIA